MFKKRGKGIALLCFCLLLSGCGNEIPELTAEQNAEVVEYAANLIETHSSAYENRLVDTSIPPKEDQKSKTEKNDEVKKDQAEGENQTGKLENTDLTQTISGMDISKDSTQQSIEQALGLDGIHVEFTGYETVDLYPQSASEDELVFSISPSAGNKLIVLHLQVSNTSQETKRLDTVSSPAKFRLKVNDGNTQSILVTMLDDDFSFQQKELEAGQTIDTVLVAEVSEDTASQISNVTLFVRLGENETKIVK